MLWIHALNLYSYVIVDDKHIVENPTELVVAFYKETNRKIFYEQ